MTLLLSRRARVVAVTAVAAGLLLVGCTGTEVLTPDPPIAEPGYPQYTPPAAPPPSPTTDPAVPDLILTPPPSPAPPTDPPPAAEEPAEPTPPPSTTPETSPTPTTTSPPPAPSPTPSPTPSAITLQAVEWSASCGGGAELISPNSEIALTLPDLPATRSGSGFGVIGWLSGQTETVPVSFATEVVVLRDGVVVAQHPGPGDASPSVALVPGTPLEVPVEHDLLTECPPPPSPAATLGAPVDTRPESASPSALGSGNVGSADTQTLTPSGTGTPATPGTPDGTGSPAPQTTTPSPPTSPSPSPELSPDTATALPPGSYTVVVAVRIAEGPGAPGVVATAAAPLTITG